MLYEYKTEFEVIAIVRLLQVTNSLIFNFTLSLIKNKN